MLKCTSSVHTVAYHRRPAFLHPFAPLSVCYVETGRASHQSRIFAAAWCGITYSGWKATRRSVLSYTLSSRTGDDCQENADANASPEETLDFVR